MEPHALERLRAQWNDYRRGFITKSAPNAAFDALWERAARTAAALPPNATMDDVLLAMMLSQEAELAEMRARVMVV